MLSQSHSVNTSIESCVTHLLRWKVLQLQSEINALCERAFSDIFIILQITLTSYVFAKDTMSYWSSNVQCFGM